MTQFALLLLLPLPASAPIRLKLCKLNRPCSKTRRAVARTTSYPSSFRRPFGWMPDGVAEHVIDDWDAEN